MEIRFYHLERSSVNNALPLIVQKAYDIGHRIAIRVNNSTYAEDLNKHLWTHKPESFLPHGTIKDGEANDIPVFITNSTANDNKATLLILTAGVKLDDIGGYDMICDVFDGSIEDELLAARKRWKAFNDIEGNTLKYFQQTAQGGWEQKA